MGDVWGEIAYPCCRYQVLAKGSMYLSLKYITINLTVIVKVGVSELSVSMIFLGWRHLSRLSLSKPILKPIGQVSTWN